MPVLSQDILSPGGRAVWSAAFVAAYHYHLDEEEMDPEASAILAVMRAADAVEAMMDTDPGASVQLDGRWVEMTETAKRMLREMQEGA